MLAFAVFDDGGGSALYAGGEFWTADGLVSDFIAFWGCSDPIFSDGFESGSASAWSSSVP